MDLKNFNFLSKNNNLFKSTFNSDLFFEFIENKDPLIFEWFDNNLLRIGVTKKLTAFRVRSNNIVYSIQLEGITITNMENIGITFDESYYTYEILEKYDQTKAPDSSMFLFVVDNTDKLKILEIFEYEFEYCTKDKINICISAAFGIKLSSGKTIIFRDVNDWNFNHIYIGDEDKINEYLKPFTYIYETDEEVYWTKKELYVSKN